MNENNGIEDINHYLMTVFFQALSPATITSIFYSCT